MEEVKCPWCKKQFFILLGGMLKCPHCFEHVDVRFQRKWLVFRTPVIRKSTKKEVKEMETSLKEANKIREAHGERPFSW